MPNTVITLKKSATPSAVPGNLANGEIAINYADGKLFYKNVAGQIVEFSSAVNAFGTINANGTLVISDTLGDVVTLVPGVGISIVGNAINDTITITATGNAVAAFESSNTANAIAVAAFVQANTARDNSNTARTVVNDSINAPRYIMFANGTSGTTTLNVAVGLTFNPSSNTLNINGPLNAVTKSFVIPHPTKAGKTLRYGSLEGPENGVYVRGRTHTPVINLPEYWSELIDASTITVNLTPVGKKQDLYVKKIEDNKVIIAGTKTIDCFYVVFAERKDVDKLVVEY